MEHRPRVLVVDDDHGIRRFLRVALQTQGLEILEASTALEALQRVRTAHPDVLVLDLVLPDQSGIELVRAIRAWSQIPILILSVRDQEEQKVEALDAGADDYLTKPFGIPELMARLRVLLRRRPAAESVGPFRLGKLEVDLERRLIRVGEEIVRLTPTEYALLRTLVLARGRILTTQQLLREVWGPGYTSQTHLLHVNISNLRRKIDPDPGESYILTEPGVGYRLRPE